MIKQRIGNMIGKIFSKILSCLLFATIIVSFYIYGLNVPPNGDNVEHLHVSWLISQGYIPYRDFFQHHNPFVCASDAIVLHL